MADKLSLPTAQKDQAALIDDFLSGFELEDDGNSLHQTNSAGVAAQECIDAVDKVSYAPDKDQYNDQGPAVTQQPAYGSEGKGNHIREHSISSEGISDSPSDDHRGRYSASEGVATYVGNAQADGKTAYRNHSLSMMSIPEQVPSSKKWVENKFEGWAALETAARAAVALENNIAASVAEARESSLAADQRYLRRAGRVRDKIQRLKESHDEIVEQQAHTERENVDAKAALQTARELKNELDNSTKNERTKLEDLTGRLAALRERLRDPLYPFVPRLEALDQSATVKGWWRFPRSVIENVLLFLEVGEVVRAEVVCKAWVRLQGKTNTLRRLLRKRREDCAQKKKGFRVRSPPRKMEYDEHYVLNIEVGASGSYSVGAVKQSVPLSYLSPVSTSPTNPDQKWDRQDETEQERARSRPSIAMKPVVQRDKSRRSVRIMFTNQNYTGLKEEMAFVTKALKTDKTLAALRKRVHYLRNETRASTTEARRWYKSEIEDAKGRLNHCNERISAYKQQLESDMATRKFLKQTLESSQQAWENLKRANAEMLAKGKENIRAKELELKKAEEAKVGQQKKLEELNTHLKILVTTAKSLKDNVTKLKAQRDQLRSRLKTMIGS